MSEYTESNTTNELLDYLGQDCEWAAECVRSRYNSLKRERAEVEAELEKYSEYTICDCCQSLTLEPVDAGGHMQCVSCTKLAELEQRIHDACEVYAGMEGFVPETAPEGYCLRIIEQMYRSLQEKAE